MAERLGRGGRARAPGVPPQRAGPAHPALETKGLIEDVKRRSGLTWDVLAQAVGVAPRSLHLWRAGGRPTAGHHERLHALRELMIELGRTGSLPALLFAGQAPTLLDRLRAGSDPRRLAPSWAWRCTAEPTLDRNLSALSAPEEPLDEDLLFLLHLEPDQIGVFELEARTLLADPGARESDWERLLDGYFARVAPTAPWESIDDPIDDPEDGPPCSFTLHDIGLSFDVGEIAAPQAAAVSPALG